MGFKQRTWNQENMFFNSSPYRISRSLAILVLLFVSLIVTFVINQSSFPTILVKRNYIQRQIDKARAEKGINVKKSSSEVGHKVHVVGTHGKNIGKHGEAARKCPRWFKSIDSDFAVWETKGGIQEIDVEAASRRAHFRLQIVGGRLYVHRYRGCFQTRFNFTILGILRLLERFPGQVPDVDIAFNCEDKPIFRVKVKNANVPTPILFQYFSDVHHEGILFPDWSFWGWPEMNILPWDEQRARIEEGGKKSGPWKTRIPRAYWRGNPKVTAGTVMFRNQGLRQRLLECANEPGFGVDAYGTTVPKTESSNITELGYMPLEDMCNHRYWIYAEGITCSVSLKYMLPCNSTLLVIRPKYYDFYTRGLLALTPSAAIVIPRDDMCMSLKENVDKLNGDPFQGQQIANRGTEFAKDDLSMDVVYSYMLHLLKAYAKLQQFVPVKSPSSGEVTLEDVISIGVEGGIGQKYFQEDVSSSPPCLLSDV